MEPSSSASASNRWSASRNLATVATVLTVVVVVLLGSSHEPARRAFALSGQKLLEEMHFILPAAIGLLILWRESRIKLDSHAAEARASQELLRQQLDFQRHKHEVEREERRERLAAIQSEAFSLRGVTAILAKQVAEELSTQSRWASDALERAKLGTHSKTLFGERIAHFRDEKQFLASQFLQSVLLPRARYLVESGGHRVFILVDSGTTLRPVLEQLGQQAVKGRENQENWLDRLEIVTNNLPGVEALMDSGRRNPNNRYSTLAVSCHLLPGVPLPVYSAVTGEQADKAVRTLWENRQPNDYFIAVMTGNWVRLRRTNPVCPIPLARGEGHQQFKQALVDCSHEVFVVASLGKLFVRWSLEEVNRALNFKTENTDPDKWPYSEVNIDDSKAKDVKLVTTARLERRALNRLTEKAQLALDYDESVVETGCAQAAKHVFFPFDNLPSNRWLELEAEFPHEATRSREFQNTYFFVSPTPAERARVS